MAKASIQTPRVDVRMTDKRANGSSPAAQYVDHSNPPQPTPGVINDIKGWETKLISMAEDLRNDLIQAGAEPGGLIYMVWDKVGAFRIKIMPVEMRASSAAAILRGLASNIESAAVQSVKVGALIEESKLNG